MTSSGLYTFGVTTPTIDLITEAYERCGVNAAELSANQIESATRSLAFMFTEWSNKGPNLFAVDQLRYPITANLASITLPVETVQILQAIIRTGEGTSAQQDLVLTGISRSDYFAIPNKVQTQTRPTQYYLERTQPPVLFLWPLADNANGTLVLYRMRMIQDVGVLNSTPDAPNRWMNAVAAGLASRLAVKYAPERAAGLTTLAGQAYEIAASEDTELVPMSITPDMTLGT